MKRNEEQMLALADKIWEYTRPERNDYALQYRFVLRNVLLHDPLGRYRPSFSRTKKSGGVRIIRPAKKWLHMTEWYLTEWMLSTCKVANDFAYINGGGVRGAVTVHQSSNYALVIDLKDAFNYVTVDKLRKRLLLYHPNIPSEILEGILDILTFNVVTPQGCRSTGFFYDLAVLPMMERIAQVCQEHKLLFTQYSDNLCVSAAEPFDFESVEAQIRQVIESDGFVISWTKRFEHAIYYIGFVIENGEFSIDPETYQKFLKELETALASGFPMASYPRILGQWNWVTQVYKTGEVPSELFEKYYRYFRVIRKIPPSLRSILNEHLHYGKLF